MKYIIVGSGFIFRRHFLSIKETGGEILDVVNETHGRGDEWKKAITNPDADCVVILAPNYLHYEIAKAANEAGKTVLCEKPLALKSEHVKDLAGRENIFVVQQLHYHEGVIKMRREISKDKHYDIHIDVDVHRDRHYFDGWKGNMELSGGPLFTLGVHYFELLLYLFGPATRAEMTSFDGKAGQGIIEGANYNCQWRVSVGAPVGQNKRFFNVNGIALNLSGKENLAEENLHNFVYQDLLQGRGVTPAQALPAIELIEKLYDDYHS